MRKIPVLLLGLVLCLLMSAAQAQPSETPEPPTLSEFRFYFQHLAAIDAAADKADAEGTPGVDTDGWRRHEQNAAGLNDREAAILKDVAYRCNQAIRNRESAPEPKPGILAIVSAAVDELRTHLEPEAFESLARRIRGFIRPAIVEAPAAQAFGTAEDELPVEQQAEAERVQVLSLTWMNSDGSFFAECATAPQGAASNQRYAAGVTSCFLYGTGMQPVPLGCSGPDGLCLYNFPPAPPGHQRWTQATHFLRMYYTQSCLGTGNPGLEDPLRYCGRNPLPGVTDIGEIPPLGGSPMCWAGSYEADTCPLAVSSAYPVTYLDIIPRQATVHAGGRFQFATPNNMQASWFVAGPGTIDASGLYKAPPSVDTQQNATITACDTVATGYCVTATVTVTPLRIDLLPDSEEVLPGGSQTFNTLITPSGTYELEWSLPVTVPGATINPLGAPANRSASFKAPKNDQLTAEVEITVKACVKNTEACGTAKVFVPKMRVYIIPVKTSLTTGETVQLNAFVEGSSLPRQVNWEILLDEAIPDDVLTVITPDTLAATYRASPVQKGQVSIRVCIKDTDTCSDYVVLTVGDPATITSVTGEWNAGDMASPFRIEGTGFGVNPTVTFTGLVTTVQSASNSVISGFVFIPLSKGGTTTTLRVMARYPNGDTFEIFHPTPISIRPAIVTVAPAAAEVRAGATQQFLGVCQTAKPAACNTGEAVTWSANAGTISPGGLYTAPATVASSTTATITACWAGGPCATARATLLPQEGPAVSVTPETASLQPGQTQQFTAQVINSTNTAVTWSISPATGSITQGGLYTAPSTFGGAATVTVTATSQADTSRKDTATVSLVPAPFTVSSTASPSLARTGTAITWNASASGGTTPYQYSVFRKKNGTTNWIPALDNPAWQAGTGLSWTPAAGEAGTWEIRIGFRDANTPVNAPVLHNPGSVRVVEPLVCACPPPTPIVTDPGKPVTFTVSVSGGTPPYQYAFFLRRQGTTAWTPNVTTPNWQTSNTFTWTPASSDVGVWEFYVWIKDADTTSGQNTYGYAIGSSLGTVEVLPLLTVTSNASPVFVNHGTAITWTATASGGSGTGRQFALVRKVTGTSTWSAPVWQTSNVLTWTPGATNVGNWDISVWVKDSRTSASSAYGASYNPGSVQVRAPLTVACSGSPSHVNPGTAITWTATASGGDAASIRYAFFRKKTGTTTWIPDVTAASWQVSNKPTWTPASTDVGTWEFSIWVKDATTPSNANTYGFASYCNPGPTEVVAPLTLTSTPSPAAAYSGQPIKWTLTASGGVPGTIQYAWNRRRAGTTDWIGSGWVTSNEVIWTPTSAEAGYTWDFSFLVKDSLTTPTQNTYGYAAWTNPASVPVVTPPTVTCTASPASITYGNALSWTATVSGGTGVGRQYAFFRKRSGVTTWTPAVTAPSWQTGNVMTWTPGSGDVGAWDTYIWVKDNATPSSMNTYGYAVGCNPGGVQVVAPLGVTSTASPSLVTHGNAVNWTATATGGVAASTQFAVVRRVGTGAWSAPVWQSSGNLSWTPASTDVNTWQIAIWVRDGNTPAGGYAASYNPGNVQVVAPLSVTGTSSPSAYYHSNPITWTATGSGGTGVGRQYALFRQKVGTSNWIPDVTAPAWQTSNQMSWTPASTDVGTWQIVVWFKDANTPSNANGYGYGAYYNAGPVQVYAHPTVSGTGSPASVSYGTTITWTATGSGGIGSAKQYALFRRKSGTSNWIPALTSPGWQTGNVLSWTPGSADVGTWEIFVWMKDANTPSTMNTYGHAAWYNAGLVEVTGPLTLGSCSASPVSSTYGKAISWTAYASGGHAATIQYALFRKKVGTTAWIPAQTTPAWQSGSVMTWTPGSGDVGGWDISIWVRDGNTTSSYAASCSPGQVQVTAPLSLSISGTPSSSPHGTTITWTAYASGGHASTIQYALFRRRPGTGNSGWIPSINSPAWQSSRYLTWTPTEDEVGTWEIYAWVKDSGTAPTQNTYGYSAGANGGAVEITAPIYQNYEPTGWVDGVDNQWIWGWACDPDYPWESNRVDIWSTSWEYLGSADASDWSSAPINSACGGGSAHYFSFYHGGSIPSGTHFWVWSIDLPYSTPGGVNVPIGGFNGSNEFVMP